MASDYKAAYEAVADLDPAIRKLEADVRAAAAADGDRMEFWDLTAKPRIRDLVGYWRAVPGEPASECVPDADGVYHAPEMAAAHLRGSRIRAAALARLSPEELAVYEALADEPPYRAVYFYLLDVLYGAE